MCGIAGIVAPGRPAAFLAERVERMGLAMTHRGPDGQGRYAADGIALEHRRLAIIDLSEAGLQPMTNERGTLHLVVNGEIYNYRTLRADLIAKGHAFRSTSDSEVVLHLYEEYGDDCLSRLDGMFALALWDEPARRLLLARDRFGIKPLYVAQRGETLCFASELTALVQSGLVAAEVAPGALYAYLAFSYVPAPQTILKGIDKLLPAESVVWEGGKLQRQIYWEPRPTAVLGSRRNALAELEHRLESSVRDHLVADVPVAAFLSGGVDSSTIVALAQRRHRMQTFCVSFPGTDVDEAPFARLVADHVGARHHEVALGLDPAALLVQAVARMDEPFADSSALPTFAVCRAARELATVVLSGDGGDEVFGGYTGRYRVAAMQAALPGPSLLARWLRCVPPWRSGRRSSLPAMLDLASLPDAERYLRERQITTPEERARLFGQASSFPYERALRNTPALAIRQATGWHPVHRALWMDLATSLADDMLTKVDRMSMAHGLEVRVPFLDHRLVEFALSLPPSWLVSPWPVEGKRLLRSLAAPLLPPGLLNRPKQGFVVPLNRWLQEALLKMFDDGCLSADSETARWMDCRAVAALRQAPLGAAPRQDVYALLVLELWLRRVRPGHA